MCSNLSSEALSPQYLYSSFPPPCCPWLSPGCRQLFWGCFSPLPAFGVCGVMVLRLSQGGTARLDAFVSLLCASSSAAGSSVHGAQGRALLRALGKPLHVACKLLSPHRLETMRSNELSIRLLNLRPWFGLA